MRKEHSTRLAWRCWKLIIEKSPLDKNVFQYTYDFPY